VPQRSVCETVPAPRSTPPAPRPSARSGPRSSTTFAQATTLVVWRLDRLARSLRDLIDIVTALEERGVGFRSLHEQVDTTSPGGRFVFDLFGALAEFERDLIRERSLAGLATARARGRNGGRPTVMTPAKITRARALYDQGDLTAVEIAKTLGVSRASVYRHVPPPGRSEV
jgi:DNA invertase Pin-like site-specific DNA recombinase